MKLRDWKRSEPKSLPGLDRLVAWAIRKGLLTKPGAWITTWDDCNLPVSTLGNAGVNLARRASFIGAVGALGFLASTQSAAADQNFTAFAYPTSGGTVNRTTPARFADIINIKEYGSTGVGSTDDTVNFQAALNAAFGTWASPHGGNGGQTDRFANKDVFIPSGNYVVSSQNQITITGAASNAGAIRLTLTSTAALATGDIVYNSGVVGTTEANAGYFITVDDATHITLVGSTFANAYVSGGVCKTPALRLRSVFGGRIFGAGMQDVKIENTVTGAATLVTNGCAYMEFNGFSISCTGAVGTGSIAIDLNWDSTGTASLNQNIFKNIAFGANGTATTSNTIGLNIGAFGQMGSEMLVENCTFFGFTNGIVTRNFNALNVTILRCGFDSNNIGIKMLAGQIPLIAQCDFHGSFAYDISFSNNGTCTILACRTESVNFLDGPAGTFHISGVQQNQSMSGFFIHDLNGTACIDNCQIEAGIITGNNGMLWLRGNTFASSGGVAYNPLATYAGATHPSSFQNTIEAHTANFTVLNGYAGKTFTNAGASGLVVFTLPTMLDRNIYVPGTMYRFRVAAAQTLRILATAGMKFRDNSGTLSVANGKIECATIGALIEIECLDGGATTDGTEWGINIDSGAWVVT